MNKVDEFVNKTLFPDLPAPSHDTVHPIIDRVILEANAIEQGVYGMTSSLSQQLAHCLSKEVMSSSVETDEGVRILPGPHPGMEIVVAPLEDILGVIQAAILLYQLTYEIARESVSEDGDAQE